MLGCAPAGGLGAPGAAGVKSGFESTTSMAKKGSGPNQLGPFIGVRDRLDKNTSSLPVTGFDSIEWSKVTSKFDDGCATPVVVVDTTLKKLANSNSLMKFFLLSMGVKTIT